jgi:hypothetical protein
LLSDVPSLSIKAAANCIYRFSEVDNAFGQWEMPELATIQYAIDNEIIIAARGYVYLRALGIAPPPFWERD